jgi:hypothetical protein
MNEEQAKNLLAQRDSQFNSVREVGEDVKLSSPTIPPPKPKEKKVEDLPREEYRAPIVESDTQPAIKSLHSNFDIGWYEVPLESLPTQGLFYPDGSRLLIKPANVSIIRHFSTVDDTNPLELNDAFDYILENLVRFNVPGMPASYKNLKDIDKLSVILHVRDATFKNGESRIVSDIACSCGHVDEKVLKWNDFEFFHFSSELMKYYNPEAKIFQVKFNDPMESDIGLTLPSIGIRNFIQKYVTAKIRQKKSYDRAFANVAPFIMDDWSNINDTMYEQELENSGTWSTNQFAAFIRIVDLVKKSTISRIKHKCTSCGAEVTAPSSFRGGIKSLFIPDLQSITR